LIHPTAIIDSSAELASDVTVGPFSLIGPEVKIDAGTVIGSHVVIKGPTSIGKHNRIYQFTSVGENPQDKKYANEVTRLEIGDRNTIREFATLHRGTKQDRSITKIGSDNLFMAYTHVAHDCVIGDHVIMANGASLAGHVQLQSHAILGGFTLVHQFTKIGQYSFAAMGSAITQDIPPFVMVGGKPTKPHGINSVGMERNGIAAEDIRLIRKAYKMIYKMNLRLEDAIDQMEDIAGDSKELSMMVNFLRCVSRGILR
jgi:UDP-N-acetylglucosamine acyltransferase